MKYKKQKYREISVDREGQLLEFLLEKLENHSRNKVKSLLKHGQIRVDDVLQTRHDVPLKSGQKVTISTVGRVVREFDELLNIIYEDDDILVINKKSGLLSVGNESEKTNTAYNLMNNYVKISGPHNRIFIVHRLDKETSGVLLGAKSEKVKLILQDNWDKIVKTREYTAVVEGVPVEKSGEIRSWLKETSVHRVYSSGKVGDGKEARTKYEVIREGSGCSLVKLALLTGRKNQIRVHMQDLGTPVVGDKKYGSKTNPLKRLCLHASKLEISHPITGENMVFKANVPRRFLGLVKHGK